MNHQHYPWLLLPVILFTLTACGEDPKLVEKREKQRVEIEKLKGEVALIDEKLKDLPPDVSSELPEAQKIFDKQSSDITRLEAEIAALENQKRNLQADYDSYRAKYQLK